MCPNFGHPVLTTSFQVYALCNCRQQACYENNKSSSKAETVSKLTVQSQLLQKKIHLQNLINNDEVWAGCPKLGHTTLSAHKFKFNHDIQNRCGYFVNVLNGQLGFLFRVAVKLAAAGRLAIFHCISRRLKPKMDNNKVIYCFTQICHAYMPR